MDQHTEGKWLIHGTKRHKDNQLQGQSIATPLWNILVGDVNMT